MRAEVLEGVVEDGRTDYLRSGISCADVVVLCSGSALDLVRLGVRGILRNGIRVRLFTRRLAVWASRGGMVARGITAVVAEKELRTLTLRLSADQGCQFRRF